MSDFASMFGCRVAESAACPPGLIFLVGPPPRREDFATDEEWYAARMRRIVQIVASEGRRPRP